MGDPVKSLRIALAWQMVTAIFLALPGGWLAGVHGAVSSLLGGFVAMAGSLVFILLAPAKNGRTQPQPAGVAWDSLGRMLKAEGAKVGVIVVLLWLVLKVYKEVVVPGFIGTFIVSVIIFSMAAFFRSNDAALLKMPEAGKSDVN